MDPLCASSAPTGRHPGRCLGPWLALACAGACGGPQLPTSTCDVLLITLDAVRADTLDFRCTDTTPNLAQLARRGVVFEQAVAGSSWTLPSHVELFTGLPPILHGVHDDGQRIDPLHPTLGEHLRARGAFTAGVFSGWYLAGAYGFARGFDRYVSAIGVDRSADDALARGLERGGEQALWAADLRAKASHADVSSARVVDRALEALAEVRDDEPLCQFVHLFDPHYDFVPPQPFDQRFDPDYAGDLDGRDYWRNPRIWDPRAEPRRRVGERDLEHLRALYRGEVAWCDQQLGRLLQGLRENGRLARTLIVVVSDHGEEFFEHGNRGHRQTLYDEVLRVPMLVVPPECAEDDARRGTRVSDQVALCDVLPTILAYAGGPPATGLWGRSLRPLIEGHTLEPRPVVSSLGMTGPPGPDGPLWLLESFRSGPTKLVRRLRLGPAPGAAQVESVEWFDHRTDAGEQTPPSGAQLDRVRAAWAAAEHQYGLLREFAAEMPRSAPDRRRTQVREVFAEELQALGYAGDTGVREERLMNWPTGPVDALEFPLARVVRD